MALIAMAVHDTEENGRSEFTRKALCSINESVDWVDNRIIIIDNGSCEETKKIYKSCGDYGFFNHNGVVKYLTDNIGTAKAINLALKERKPGEHCIKMDNDVVIHHEDWVDEMEAAIEREPQIGICGLKRKDLWQYPGHPEKQYRSELIMLPHKAGEKWIVVERTKDIMGTCTMFNSALLDKVGGLYQPSLYGYDDVLMSYRSELAGFINVFLPHIEIDHIDPGGTEYCDWKQKESGKVTQDVIRIVDEYIAGTKSIYVEP